MGRYITSDPIGLNCGVNIYAYANNNTLKYIDPTGEICILGGSVELYLVVYPESLEHWLEEGTLKVF